MSYNPYTLLNKTILITGASSGIGKATAIACSKMGAKIIITGRNAQRLQETFDELENGAHAIIVADLLSKSDLELLINSIDKLDGIVHSAGIARHMLFNFLKEEQFDEMMEINFKIPTILTQQLLKQKKINNKSSIVFLTSISGIIFSYIGGSIYSASKGALNGLIKGLALEYASKNIRFNGVMPAMVETHLIDESDITDEQLKMDRQKYPLKRYGRPEEVAYAVIYLLSDASAWTTGTNILLDGGRTISL
ncbi:SDR family oxidoreductase [Flavobacterium sp. F-380]|uniref:SDR family oxidoreductase n=1 Tax=Flavobacterium kayseriense TaxID=2764714 RepID=A0ABR7J7H6_9FLAO|nr:SDR family oxidoreductase [Flavobacterium kayseriense]MBC5841484.1 SDR family oxidoreductase [Flavobacterium kayseriense]MBC5848012.1 SDR family oxidoreductase [Flavobacterium kayseriense]